MTVFGAPDMQFGEPEPESYYRGGEGGVLMVVVGVELMEIQISFQHIVAAQSCWGSAGDS